MTDDKIPHNLLHRRVKDLSDGDGEGFRLVDLTFVLLGEVSALVDQVDVPGREGVESKMHGGLHD